MVPKEYVIKDYFGTWHYKNPEMDIFHRERGLPAWECRNGDEVHWENGEYHRLDGFARDLEYHKYHCLNGKRLFVKKLY